MKTGIKTHIVIAFILSVFACQPHKIVPYGPEPPLYNTEDRLFAPDSVLSYAPVLGNAGQVLQFPFGSAGMPSRDIRLVGFSESSRVTKFNTVFRYDDSGRLTQWTRYDIKGSIWSQYTYQFNADRGIVTGVLAEINSDVNNIGLYGLGGTVKSNELVLGYSSKFESVENNKSSLLRTDNVNFPFYILKAGTTQTKLSFGTEGRLAKQEVLYRNGVDETITSSKIFKRNNQGNILFAHFVSIGYEDITYYNYDNKPNPFRTTGDIGLLKDLLPGELADASNVNNILSMETISKDGTVNALYYVYEYRPDGYPISMKVFSRGELISTREFVYNQ